MIGNRQGFSLFEMLIVVAIMGIVALAAVPVAEITYVKTQETILEKNLEDIRTAISLWKRDCRNVVVAHYGYAKLFDVPDSQLCPPSLEALTKAVSQPIMGSNSVVLKDESNADIIFHSQPYLPSIPQDPFVGAAEWVVHFASGTVGDFKSGITNTPAGAAGVFDVSCVSDPVTRRGFVTAIDGTKYEDW